MWQRAVFSTGVSTTGKGWQNWQKAIFNRVSEGTLETFLVRFGGGLFLAPEAVQREKASKIGKSLSLIEFQKGR